MNAEEIKSKARDILQSTEEDWSIEGMRTAQLQACWWIMDEPSRVRAAEAALQEAEKGGEEQASQAKAALDLAQCITHPSAGSMPGDEPRQAAIELIKHLSSIHQIGATDLL